MTPQLLHTKALVTKADNAEEGVIEAVVGSTSVLDRMGDVIDQNGWELDNYKKNPVILWGHNIREERPPIGKAIKVWLEGVRKKKLMFNIKFDLQDPFAAEIYRKVKEGFIHAVSVGFLPKEWEDNVFKIMELFELSFVPVPANPEALAHIKSLNPVETMEKLFNPMKLDAFKDLKIVEHKRVIPFKDRGIAPESESWDGPGQMAACKDVKETRKICTWFDEKDVDKKTAYKLPHHRQSDFKAVFRGVAGAMAALMGARSSLDIPEEERRGVYNHLAKHYEQFSKEAPDFKMVEQQILRGLDEELLAITLDREDKHIVRLLKKLIKLVKETKPKQSAEPTEDDVTNALKVIDIALGKALKGGEKK